MFVPGSDRHSVYEFAVAVLLARPGVDEGRTHMGPTTLVPGPPELPSGVTPEVLVVAGTELEAIKLGPLAAAMRAAGRIHPVLVACLERPTTVVTAMGSLGLSPDVSVDLGPRGQDPALCARALLATLDKELDRRKPAAVVVQGDTVVGVTTALAAFWRKIPVVHLDAGIRSHDLTSPFPDEGHRRLVAQVCSLHLTTTRQAVVNLADESLYGPKVVTVGSTVVDAACEAAARPVSFADERLDVLRSIARAADCRIVPVCLDGSTWSDKQLENVLHGIADLVLSVPDVEVVLPAQRGSELHEQAQEMLGRLVRVAVTDPLTYPELVELLSLASLTVSDRPLVQEQAPSFGVPVLALRDHTSEWSEPAGSGEPWVVGTDRASITRIAEKVLLTNGRRRPTAPEDSPLGDGFAAKRCEEAVSWLLGLLPRPVEFSQY